MAGVGRFPRPTVRTLCSHRVTRGGDDAFPCQPSRLRVGWGRTEASPIRLGYRRALAEAGPEAENYTKGVSHAKGTSR